MRLVSAALFGSLFALPALVALPALAATPPAISADPMIDAAHAPAMIPVRIPSHGELINGVLYTASGPGPHPALLLFHGFPGFEQNLDLAQAARRAGFDVLTLHYRGSWASPGAFSFTNALEDSDAALAFLRANASGFGIDTARIFAAGHDMGGLMAASVAAHDPEVAGLIMISAWDIGADGPKFADPKYREAQAKGEFNEDVVPLSGTSVKALMDEAQAASKAWDFVEYAPLLKSRPVLIFTTHDRLTENNERLAKALRALGDQDVSETLWETDDAYSDRRIALQSDILAWLDKHAGIR